MTFQFNVVKAPSSENTNPDAPKIDYAAEAKYIAEMVGGTESKKKSMIGVISGIIDLGMQIEEDAKMEFKGTAEDEAAELQKNPNQYFETLPNEKGVPTRYKRWKVKNTQKVAITVDFPSTMLDRGQFYGDTSQTLRPYRMLLNGEFFQKGVGRIVNKAYSVKESKNADGSWSFKPTSQLFKLAAATDSLDEKGQFKAGMIGNLLGKAALFEVAAYTETVGDKVFLQEKIKFAGQIPDMMLPMAEPLIEQAKPYLYGVNFAGETAKEIAGTLRMSVVNTMSQATNFKGSDIEKVLIEVGKYKPRDGQQTVVQQQTPVQREEQRQEDNPVEGDNFDDDLPF